MTSFNVNYFFKDSVFEHHLIGSWDFNVWLWGGGTTLSLTVSDDFVCVEAGGR